MTKLTKQHNNLKEYIIPFLILFITFFIILNPSTYMSSTLKGISVWATIVVPSLLPFFFLTKMLISFKSVYKISSIFSYGTKKLYNCPNISSYIFFMSIISGYPVGAKLISEFYKNKTIDNGEAHRLISFCSTSGPMFIIGSVGVSLFLDRLAGIIIFISHILSSLINGLIYRKHKLSNLKNKQENIQVSSFLLNECMYNTIISVLTVGGFIAISFTIIEIMLNLNLLYPLETLINLFFKGANITPGKQIAEGIIEVTRGCVDLSSLNLKPIFYIPIVSGLVSFGGLSIHLQSFSFLQECDIKYKFFLLTKLTHLFISVFVSLILYLIIY